MRDSQEIILAEIGDELDMQNETEVSLKDYSQFLSSLSNGMDDGTIQCSGDTGGRPGLRQNRLGHARFESQLRHPDRFDKW